MGNALLNFRELAQLEEKEPRVVEMIDRFEATQSDLLKESILSSLSFIRLFGDIAQLYFPTMLDIAVTGMGDDINASTRREIPENKVSDTNNTSNSTPDQGGKEPPSSDIPGADGPTQV